LGNLRIEPVGNVEARGMRKAQVEVNRLALDLAAVTSAVQLEHALVAVGDTFHHRVDEGTTETLNACVIRTLRVSGHHDGVRLLLGDDTGRKRALQLALGALNVDDVA